MHVAYSRDGTVQDALEIIKIYRYLSPGLSTDRVCIKIPATYEGLEACRILEAQGIKTLATTLFSVEQAILADEVGCEYVAPYVNELKVRRCIGYSFNSCIMFLLRTTPLPGSLRPRCCRSQQGFPSRRGNFRIL